MGLTSIEKNIIAYRILTINDLKITTVDNIAKETLSREIKDTDFGGEKQEDKQEILRLEDELEWVKYLGSRFMTFSTGEKLLVLIVEVTDDEGSTELLELEYMLIPRDEYNEKDLYKILVIEEE